MTLAAGIPSPDNGVWHLGPLPLRAYAVAILAGIVAGAYVAVRRYRARGGPENVVVDAMFWAVPAGIIGARIYHVLSSPHAYFGEHGDPVRILYVWEGGLGIWGAIPAGAFAAWLMLRRHGLRLSTFADALAPGILIAQAIGRLGNYFNQELFGEATTAPWGLQISDAALAAQGLDYPSGTLFHPTFGYELLWNLIGAGVIIMLDRRLRLGYGRVFWLYVAVYTLGRAWIEMLRIDTAEHVLGLRLNVWTAIVVFVIAVALFVFSARRHPGREPSAYLPGARPETAEVEDVIGEDQDPPHDLDTGESEVRTGSEEADPADGDGAAEDDVADLDGPSEDDVDSLES